MNILHVISSVNPKGGGPIEGIKQLHAPLQALGVKVEIALVDYDDFTIFDKIYYSLPQKVVAFLLFMYMKIRANFKNICNWFNL